MKVYSIDYSLNERSPKKITVTPHSDIKIAIKAEEDGCILSECDIALYKSDGCVLTPDEEMIDDYKVWTVETTDSGTEEYKVDIKGNEFKLTQFVNDSTIFEVDEQGGGGCGCGDSLWEEDGCYIAPKNGFPIVVHSNDASDINDICFNGCIGFGGEESTDYCGSQMEYGCAIIQIGDGCSGTAINLVADTVMINGEEIGGGCGGCDKNGWIVVDIHTTGGTWGNVLIPLVMNDSCDGLYKIDYSLGDGYERLRLPRIFDDGGQVAQCDAYVKAVCSLAEIGASLEDWMTGESNVKDNLEINDGAVDVCGITLQRNSFHVSI